MAHMVPGTVSTAFACSVLWASQAIKGFRAKLEAGQFAIGPSIGLKDAVVADAIAPEADFIWYARCSICLCGLFTTALTGLGVVDKPRCRRRYDQEHATMSPDQLQNHIFAAHGRGCPVIVR